MTATHSGSQVTLNWEVIIALSIPMPVFRAVHGRAPGVRQVWPNLRRKETNLKADIQGKRLQAGWKEDFQQAVLRR